MKFLILNNHKLNLNQFPENYHLIAIHSDLDEFRLAFFLNKKLNIVLKRKKNDIYFPDQDANYSSYEFLDETKYLKWIFFSNKSLVSWKLESYGTPRINGEKQGDFEPIVKLIAPERIVTKYP